MKNQSTPVSYYKYLSVFALCFSLLFFFTSCQDLKSKLIKIFSKTYSVDGKFQKKPTFTDKDKKRKKVSVVLTEIASATEPTDICFLPGENPIVLMLEKKGNIKWSNWVSTQSGVLLKLDVISESELGLLGISLHPKFEKNGKIYLNYTIKKNGIDTSRVSEWVLSNRKTIETAKMENERILFELKQPYPNHNAGQIAFGKDGMLYIGWGDGGWKGDPENNAQNPKTYLGSMLRINVDERENDKPYSIPKDNPLKKDWRPEIFAIGLRNPWRFSFSPEGKLLLADVGQFKWEEINIIESGKNYGWNHTEGFHCYSPAENCKLESFSPPIYEYGREDGSSVTGGYVYSGERIPALKDKYIFGDFISGRIWALDLSEGGSKSKDAIALGRWNILISTFGQDRSGEVYVSDFQKGKIYRIDPDN